MEFVTMPFRIWHNITAYVFPEYDTLWRVSEKQKRKVPLDNFHRWDIDRCDCACMQCAFVGYYNRLNIKKSLECCNRGLFRLTNYLDYRAG